MSMTVEIQQSKTKRLATIEIEDLFTVLEIKRFLQCDMFFDGLNQENSDGID